MNPSDFVSTFLDSVGQKQHVQLYLRIFRQLPKESFAVVAPEPQLLRHASGVVVEALRFLSDLELRVTLAIGLLGDSGPPAATVAARLNAARAPFALLPLPAENSAHALKEHLRDQGNALLDLRELPKEARADALGTLLDELGTRKLVVLRSRGGLGPHQHGRVSLDAGHSLLTDPSGISVVNLTTDLERLSTRHLGRAEADLLRVIARLHAKFPPLLTSVTSPFHLIQELFTVKGAGTLIKTGSTISEYDDFSELDVPRLVGLVETTFGRPLSVDLTSVPARVYLEQQYRGVAIVSAGTGADYLSKFAVSPVAQGEGIGRDLWEALTVRHPALYWRSSPDNPIADWYARECDGLHRDGDWVVYWRGVNSASIPSLIDDARARPHDFHPRQSTTP
jgi:acetylglutamate kinase